MSHLEQRFEGLGVRVGQRELKKVTTAHASLSRGRLPPEGRQDHACRCRHGHNFKHHSTNVLLGVPIGMLVGDFPEQWTPSTPH